MNSIKTKTNLKNYLISSLLIFSLTLTSFATFTTESFGLSDAPRKANQLSAAGDQTSTPVIFVGNNWDGVIDVIDANSYEHLGVINGIPDKDERISAIHRSFFRMIFFYINRYFVGEGNDQYVDDMYSSNDGRLLIVSRPSLGDVVAIDMANETIEWRFQVDGFRSDHMAISPDGSQVAVSASTGKVVHILDTQTGEELGRFKSGDSPHENVYSKDGNRIFHASIGHVWTPWDKITQSHLKGKRIFKVVNANTYEDILSFDISDRLTAANLGHLSPAIRPMAHTADEDYFYFQLSFLHGFIEYDMVNDQVSRLYELPRNYPDMPRTQYVNDSAHHGIAISGDDTTFCVAGTMDDYVAIVDRETGDYKILNGIGEKPYWVTTNKNGDHCYISWSETDAMSVVSYETGEEIAHIPVGDHPQRIREGFVTQAWLDLVQ